MAYQPARARLAAGRTWRPTHLRRMEPNAVYYLVFGGAGALVGVVIDAISPLPWWVGLGSGLGGAWALTWLTALDDVRYPWRSLRILAATLQDPAATIRVRALAYRLPLFAPTPEWAGTRRLSGGGLSFGRSLLSPARPSATVTWTSDHGRVQACTATRPTGEARPGRLPLGIGHQLVDIEDEPGMEGVTVDALVDGLRPVIFDVEGRPLAGTVHDLTAQGLGWLAEARIDELFVVEVAGDGVDPDRLPLVMLTADDVPELPHN